MHSTTMKCVRIALVILSATAHAQAQRSVEIPLGKAGEIEIGEVVSRLAAASGVVLERPAAHMTLSTQGFARPP